MGVVSDPEREQESRRAGGEASDGTSELLGGADACRRLPSLGHARSAWSYSGIGGGVKLGRSQRCRCNVRSLADPNQRPQDGHSCRLGQGSSSTIRWMARDMFSPLDSASSPGRGRSVPRAGELGSGSIPLPGPAAASLCRPASDRTPDFAGASALAARSRGYDRSEGSVVPSQFTSFRIWMSTRSCQSGASRGEPERVRASPIRRGASRTSYNVRMEGITALTRASRITALRK